MTSQLLNGWGVRSGQTKESRSSYVLENKDKFPFPETFEQFYDLLRDKVFSQMATLAILARIEEVCNLSGVSLPDLFISNDIELSKIDGWSDEFNPIITNAATRFKELQRDSS